MLRINQTLKRKVRNNMPEKVESNQSKGMETAYPQSNYLFKDVAYLD
jgi:hypothetical protein